MTERLALGFGLQFDDLYRRDGLVRLDGCFVDALDHPVGVVWTGRFADHSGTRV